MKQAVYQQIFNTSNAMDSCIKNGNNYFADKHSEMLSYIVDNCLPHGSGFDSGIELGLVNSSKIELFFSYHHMNENGYYTHWSRHKVTIKPSFNGIELHITKNRQGDQFIDYCYDVLYNDLCQTIDTSELINKYNK